MYLTKFSKLLGLALCVGLIWAPTVMGQANSYVLDLDGNGDYVNIPDSDNLTDFTFGYTWQCWIFLPQLGTNMPIASKWATLGNQRAWAFTISNSGQIRLRLSSDGIEDLMWQTGNVVTTDRWHHVAVVYQPGAASGQRIRFYLDNVIKGHNPATDPPSSIFNNTANMYIGRHIGQYCYGYIDEFRMTDWSVASFPNYILDPPLNPTMNTEVLYHFDEGSGGSVTDFATIAGNPDNSGTLMGNAAFTNWDGMGPGNDLPLPVTLISLVAAGGDRSAEITWTTETEYDNLGFHLYRSTNQLTGFSRITSELIPSQGFSVSTQTYIYEDNRDLINGVTYFYKISDVDVNGRERVHEIVASATPISQALIPGDNSDLAGYQLSQNYPNPFNATTTIRYYVRNGGNVNLGIYDTSGREITTLLNGVKEPGEYFATFDASSFPTGIYFVRLTGSDGYDNIKKMLYLK
ncbi:MAG: T9SS type A sorting domain-containing protein [bacterium]|nr:T9SS type A sorting domain-containing protein [bacterium]